MSNVTKAEICCVKCAFVQILKLQAKGFTLLHRNWQTFKTKQQQLFLVLNTSEKHTSLFQPLQTSNIFTNKSSGGLQLSAGDLSKVNT